MMINKQITERLASFRSILQQNSLDAYIVPTNDPHVSEYLADHWKSRQWLSNFTGSAGTLVVTTHAAALWIDSRYYLQADTELEGTTIEPQRVVLIEYIDIANWLGSQLTAGCTVGIDAEMISSVGMSELTAGLLPYGIDVRSDIDAITPVWNDRPGLPTQPPFIFTQAYAGEDAPSKLQRLRAHLINVGTTATLVTALDEVAWLLNIRGNDIECNPVVMAYVYVSTTQVVVFMDPIKVTQELHTYFHSIGATVQPYTAIVKFLQSTEDTMLIDRSKVNYKLISALPPTPTPLFDPSPIAQMKAIKNETEIAGFRSAMVKDGVALVQFFRWLEQSLASSSTEITEATLAEKLIEIKQCQPHFVGESFSTIAGFNANGAIVHYHAITETAKQITPDGLLLFDCGSQYLDGTTDITRTIRLGELSKQQRRDYTLVLKGHIALSAAIFPRGTRGTQLDILARSAMWADGLNYLHGTGHGIGHFLNVHEGPQSIRMNENPVCLEPGMVLSNEPGLYRVGEYGIRVENLILVVPHQTTPFGEFYQFETLTLYPYEMEAIEWSMLTPREEQLIHDYHQTVFTTLAPHLTSEEKDWLKLKIKR